jgi:chemotaxis protein methyltransferase CheR
MTPLQSDRQVGRLRQVVAERLGMQFDDSRLPLLAETLQRHGGSEDHTRAAWLDRLARPGADPELLQSLARELTVTETCFFRYPDQFRAFAQAALPARLAACAPGRRLRVLSAGCASGDEPYSLAILLREQWPQAVDQVVLHAVDINPAALQKARRAHYTAWALREVAEHRRQRWFRADATGFELDTAIRDAVRFEARNLVDDDPELWPREGWDIVFCRNVLMYFTPEQMRAVVERIERSLVPGGYLFLGHAETLRGLSTRFHLCHSHDTFYYQLRDAVAARCAEPAPQAVQALPASLVELTRGGQSWVDTVQHASDRIGALAAAARALPGPGEPPPRPDLAPALEAMRGERFERALEQLDALPAEQSHDPDVLLLRAASLVHRGALQDAERACAQLLRRDELHAGARYILALCREASGETAQAIEQDQIACYLDPGFAMPRLHMGLLARRGGRHDEARRELEQAMLLLEREDASRLLLFGGGFKREALVALCRAELAACVEHA